MSVRWQVGQAVQSVLQGLPLVGDPGLSGSVTTTPAKVFLRKDAVPDKAQDEFPMVLVVPEEELPAEALFGNVILARYPILVVLVAPRGHQPEQGQFAADARERVRKTLWRPHVLGPVPTQFDADYEAEPSWDAGSWGKDFSARAQRFVFHVSEARADS